MSHINCDRCLYKWNNNDRHGGSIPNNHLVRDMFKVTFNYKIDKISHLSPSTFVLCVGFGLFSFLENRGPCANDYMTSFSGGFTADAMSNLGNRSLKLSRNSFSGPFFWLQSRMCPSLNPLWITCIELFFGRYPRFRRGVCE